MRVSPIDVKKVVLTHIIGTKSIVFWCPNVQVKVRQFREKEDP